MFYASGNFHALDKDILFLLEGYENRIYISSESIKEAIPLFQNGRIRPKWWKTPEDIFHYIEHGWCITINYVKEEHFYTLVYLDVVPGHNDSTDRMIVTHAYGASPADQFRPDVRTLP